MCFNTIFQSANQPVSQSANETNQEPNKDLQPIFLSSSFFRSFCCHFKLKLQTLSFHNAIQDGSSYTHLDREKKRAHMLLFVYAIFYSIPFCHPFYLDFHDVNLKLLKKCDFTMH